jgi:hypothetical protein
MMQSAVFAVSGGGIGQRCTVVPVCTSSAGVSATSTLRSVLHATVVSAAGEGAGATTTILCPGAQRLLAIRVPAFWLLVLDRRRLWGVVADRSKICRRVCRFGVDPFDALSE